jgi:hypothetical protein
MILRYDSSNNKFYWDPNPSATKYRISISINSGGYSTLYEGSATECDLNLPFACEVIGEGQSQQSGSWGPPVKCIDNPIAFLP